MWVTLAVLVAGFGSGVLAAVLGVGGAVITTPMIRALGATPIAAVGSTVPAILPGALSGSLRFHREGYIVWPVALTCGVSGMSFAVLGGWVAVRHWQPDPEQACRQGCCLDCGGAFAGCEQGPYVRNPVTTERRQVLQLRPMADGESTTAQFEPVKLLGWRCL